MALGTTENTVAKITGYVVKNALMAFKNSRLFSGLVTKEYNNEFAERGAKKGDTIYVRKPAQFRVRTGSAMKTQNIHETKIPVVIGEQKGVDFEFSIREATLDIDHNKADYADSKAAMEGLVLEERQREFLFEGKRWFDLVRFARRDGDNSRLINLASRKYLENVNAIKIKLADPNIIYYPYAKSELKVNPLLKQNPAFTTGEDSELNR